MNATLQEIRKKLRLRMDGSNSAAMRQRGVTYKLNFGVPIMTLRQLAAQYDKNSELAEALWNEDARELKILATLLYPPEQFYDANQWVAVINNLELAEQACMNLFSDMPKADEYALHWIQSVEIYTCLSGFLLYTRLFMKGYAPLPNELENYFQTVEKAFKHESLLLKNAALTSLKKLGIQSKELAEAVLIRFKQESAIYEDLKFEFEFFGKNINFVPR